MKVSVETRGELERRMSVTIPAAQVGSRYQAQLSQAAKELRIKGFRPGKVPKSELERRYGKRLRREVALDIARGAWHRAALQESLNPATSPRLELGDWREGVDLHFHATFECMPEIALADFGELSLVRPQVEIGEKDVDSVLEEMCRRFATWEPVGDRASQTGDRLRLAFELKDVERAEVVASQEDMIQPVQDRTEDATALPPREGLVGVRAGEDCEYDWEVPEEYPSEEISGRTLRIHYHIKEVQREVIPDPEAPAVLANAGVDTIEALRQQTQASIERYKDSLVDSLLREQALRRLADISEFSLPEGLVLDQLRRDAAEQAQLSRLREARGLPAQSSDESESEARRTKACEYVKAALLLRAILEKHELTVEDEHLQAEVRKRAGASADPQAKYLEILQDEEELRRIESELRQHEAMQYIVDHASIQDREETYESLLRLTPFDLMPDLQEAAKDKRASSDGSANESGKDAQESP